MLHTAHTILLPANSVLFIFLAVEEENKDLHNEIKELKGKENNSCIKSTFVAVRMVLSVFALTWAGCISRYRGCH